jgi:hypothetical protein
LAVSLFKLLGWIGKKILGHDRVEPNPYSSGDYSSGDCSSGDCSAGDKDRE